MSALRKVSDSDITTEIILPDSIKKAAEVLKSEQQKLGQEIDQVKSEAVRKVDESTRVFNLRQAELLGKIKELELKKAQIEKELNIIMRQKNSKLHEELKKVTLVLVDEIKKISPLEKDLESGMAKISNLKNEMQILFESSIDERKRNSKIIDDQKKELQQIGVLIKDTSTVIEKDLRGLVRDIESISREKMELMESVSRLKADIANFERTLETYPQKKAEFYQIESALAAHQSKLVEIKETELKLNSLKEALTQHKKEQDEIHFSIKTAQEERSNIINNNSKQELELKHLENQTLKAKEVLLGVEREIIEAKKNLDLVRNEQLDMQRKYQSEQSSLERLKTEIAQSEGVKAACLKLQEDAHSFYEEKKAFYARELELVEEKNKARITELDISFEKKKLEWEIDFKRFTEEKEKLHQESLDAMKKDWFEDIKRRKQEISNQITEIVKKQLSRSDFASTEQRVKEVKQDVDAIFDRSVGKTSRWKLWW
jgi:hypothetical protein